jgi:hypothetical protein
LAGVKMKGFFVSKKGVAFALMLFSFLSFLQAGFGVEVQWRQGMQRDFPEVRSEGGEARLGEGAHLQWVEEGVLKVRVTYALEEGREVTEEADFRQDPELIQDRWEYREYRGGALYQHFQFDFRTGQARAQQRKEGGAAEQGAQEFETWSEQIDTQPGQAFTGLGFNYALMNLRSRLVDQEEQVDFEAIAFMPGPRKATVRLTHEAQGVVQMGGRVLPADLFRIRPQVGWLGRLFVSPPDFHIWLHREDPPAFLRFQGPIGTPDDPVVQVSVLPQMD